MPPCSPSDSVLMNSLFLFVSPLHQLSRVPALLRWHPSKVLTRALQQLIAASWCVICRVAKGMVITLTSICERRFFCPSLFFKTKPEAACWGLSLYCSLKKVRRCQKWDSNSLVQERLCLGRFGHPDTPRSPPTLLVHSQFLCEKTTNLRIFEKRNAIKPVWIRIDPELRSREWTIYQNLPSSWWIRLKRKALQSSKLSGAFAPIYFEHLCWCMNVFANKVQP